ncbi:MAG: macro domain-containing protein [Chitinophagaceae bacterium]
MRTTTLYRPVGEKELSLIAESGFKAFPPRLGWQPIFYPVLNQQYAEQIAQEWNTKDEFSGYEGHVLAFDIEEAFLQRYTVQNVGGSIHNELWIPAAELPVFNEHIIGKIRKVKSFYGDLHAAKHVINYAKGDATKPDRSGNKLIVHICNDIGGWGKGFVLALSSRWKAPEQQYRQWFDSKKDFQLGAVQFVQVEKELWVANVIGQHGIKKASTGEPPIRYDAIRAALENIAGFAIDQQASIHMPRIGCGLAGGKWELIEPIILQKLTSKQISVTVYDL